MSPALPCSRWLLAVLGALVVALPLPACPFCARDGKTLANEVQDAAFVVYGRMANSKVVTNADGTETSSTELWFEEEDILKPHDFLRGKKMILLPKYLPKLDEKQPDRCVIFCYYYQGNIDPYLMFVVRDKQFVTYLKGTLGRKQENKVDRLKFFFDHLDSENLEISNDAYREFSFAAYPEVRDLIAKHREAVRTKLLQWLHNRDAHIARLGLLGMMLGLAGKPEDVSLLRDTLQDTQVATGIDGMLAGYVMLDRKAGWEYLVQTLRDNKLPFHRRHAALRTLRFFLREHTDFVPTQQIWAACSLLLDDTGLADLALNEMRQGNYWGQLDRILTLEQKPSHQTPIILKAILQYMLRCPDEKAKQYVARMRQTAPERVRTAEEDLLYEQPVP
jgi:hypothetical protein